MTIYDLKEQDIFRYSYTEYQYENEEDYSYGFARVIHIQGKDITCSDIFIEGNQMNAVASFELTPKEYKILEIIVNRPSDLDIIKDLYPEKFI